MSRAGAVKPQEGQVAIPLATSRLPTSINSPPYIIDMYKLPRANRYLKMSLSAQKYSSLIRDYVETL